MTLVKMNSEKDALRDSMFPSAFDQLFRRFFDDRISAGRDGGGFFVPSADILEDEEAFTVELSLPGLNKEEVKIDLKDNVLVISGERKNRKEEKKSRYHKVETSYGAFSRSFVLPEQVDRDQIDAEFKNGMLSIRLPKTEKSLDKTISIR